MKLYCILIALMCHCGVGNSLVTQGFGNDGNWKWSNLDGQQIFFDGIMGGLTGQLGSSLGGAISPYVSELMSGIGGQAVQQGLTQAVTGSATGFALGTGVSLMNGAELGDALKAGGQGALTGFAVGAASGMASGMRAAYKAGENPWTGEKIAGNGGTSLWPAASNGTTTVNGIEYTTHALERMQPVGTIMDGTASFSRGIPPSAIENAIKFGTVTHGNTSTTVVRTYGNIRVVTNPQGTRVITVIKLGH